jgi:serine/threonine protein kinase
MDFGIAKQHGATTGAATVTATGTLMGTPEYMSPEQLRGDEVDFRSDLYSLGVVAYELFSGSLPFRGETAVATIVKQLQQAPFLDLPTLPAPLRPLLARALAKNPDERYATPEMHRPRGAYEAAARARSGRRVDRRADDETRPVLPGECQRRPLSSGWRSRRRPWRPSPSTS